MSVFRPLKISSRRVNGLTRGPLFCLFICRVLFIEPFFLAELFLQVSSLRRFLPRWFFFRFGFFTAPIIQAYRYCVAALAVRIAGVEFSPFDVGPIATIKDLPALFIGCLRLQSFPDFALSFFLRRSHV